MPSLSPGEARERRGGAEMTAIARRPASIEESMTYDRMILAFQLGMHGPAQGRSRAGSQVIENRIGYARGYFRD
jgi:hypothetical protein